MSISRNRRALPQNAPFGVGIKIKGVDRGRESGQISLAGGKSLAGMGVTAPEGMAGIMTKQLLAATAIAALLAPLAGCGAKLPGMSTSAITAPQPAQPQNDPVSRAMQVGTTSARAIKCGFNFDPVKLRTQFLAAETATNPAEADKITRVYDTSVNGVAKAVSGQGESYCTDEKNATIKEALTRHLAGDYAPPPPKPVVDEGGLFDAISPDNNGGDSEFAKQRQKGIDEQMR